MRNTLSSERVYHHSFFDFNFILSQFVDPQKSIQVGCSEKGFSAGELVVFLTKSILMDKSCLSKDDFLLKKFEIVLRVW